MTQRDNLTVNVYNKDWTRQHRDHYSWHSVIELSLRFFWVAWTTLCLAEWTYRCIAVYLLMARKAGLQPQNHVIYTLKYSNHIPGSWLF